MSRMCVPLVGCWPLGVIFADRWPFMAGCPGTGPGLHILTTDPIRSDDLPSAVHLCNRVTGHDGTLATVVRFDDVSFRLNR
uniref:Putative secreted protein n=1 Tax=Anopheles darlingi TaxID=43151 RepID=A0A2M4DIG4_ANODA